MLAPQSQKNNPGFFSRMWGSIKGFFSSTYDWIKGNIAKPIYDAGSSVLKGGKDIIMGTEDHLQNTVTGVWNKIGSTAENSISSLSMPLMVGGVIILLVILKK